jgi:hypothetical protein
MKRRALLLTLGLVGLGGCVLSQPDLPIAPPPMRTTSPVPPVRAEQVTTQTAEKMSQALADELDREAQQELTPPALPRQ